MWLISREVAQPAAITKVAGKNLTSNVKNNVSAMKKNAEMKIAEIMLDFNPYFLKVCIVRRPLKKRSPNPRRMLPLIGKVGKIIAIGNSSPVIFEVEATMDLVMNT